jgi:Ca-activated chloride channel homolog
MTLATPLVLLLLIPLLAFLLQRAVRPRPALAVADLSLYRAVARPTLRTRLRWLPDVIRLFAVVLLVIAVARPREGVAEVLLPEEGIDIVVAVDVSSSMLQPVSRGETRMQAARRVLADFMDTLDGSRVGLVIFQSSALTISPLTHDHDAIRSRIRGLAPGLLMDGTAIGLGIAESLTLLENSPARNRVVVLMTDGENNTGEITPAQAARLAQTLGIRVYLIGFTGTGQFGFTFVNHQVLGELAAVTGGAYFDARTPEDLADAYDEIARLERSRIGERVFLGYREFGPLIALGAVALLVVDGVLRSTWLRRQP